MTGSILALVATVVEALPEEAAAAAAGAAAPMGAQAEGLFALFDRLGYGSKDFSGILQMLRGRLNELDG